MYSEYSLCHKSTVYVLRVQFMSQEYSLCPHGTVYVPRVLFISQEYSFCLKITVYRNYGRQGNKHQD